MSILAFCLPEKYGAQMRTAIFFHSPVLVFSLILYYMPSPYPLEHHLKHMCPPSPFSNRGIYYCAKRSARKNRPHNCGNFYSCMPSSLAPLLVSLSPLPSPHLLHSPPLLSCIPLPSSCIPPLLSHFSFFLLSLPFPSFPLLSPLSFLLSLSTLLSPLSVFLSLIVHIQMRKRTVV
jgi:hypothetical protein